jgi:hypothetical protein
VWLLFERKAREKVSASAALVLELIDIEAIAMEFPPVWVCRPSREKTGRL